MSCGIICPLDPDSPFMELARIRAFVDSIDPDGNPREEVARMRAFADTLPRTHYDEPKPDQFERWLMLFMGAAFCVGGIIILGLLAYGVTTTIIAAV